MSSKFKFWNNKILQQEQKCALMRNENTFRKSPRIYLSILGADTKLKYAKSQKHKNVYSDTCHTYFRSSHRRCSVEKGVLVELSQNSQENTCARVSSLKKLQAWGLYYKKDTGTVVFLWILQNFKEHLFYRTSPNDCFWYLHNKQLHQARFFNNNLMTYKQ